MTRLLLAVLLSVVPASAAAAGWTATLRAASSACSAISLADLEVGEGTLSVVVSHPTNGTTFLSARIADDGTFTAYGAGLHAGVSVSGWVRDRAGRIDAELSGETACDASWSLTAS